MLHSSLAATAPCIATSAVLSLRQIPTLIVPHGQRERLCQVDRRRRSSKSLAAWSRFCTAGDNVRTIDLGTIQPLPPDRSLTRLCEPWTGESLEKLHFVPDGPRVDLPELAPRILQSQHRRSLEAEREVALRNRILPASPAPAWTQQSIAVRWSSHAGCAATEVTSFALLQVLGGFRPPHMQVSAEINGQWQTVADEPGMLVAVGNGPQYGDGMRLTHLADMDDGLLDVCFVRRLSKLRLLRLFRVVFRGGHIGMKEVEYLQTTRVRISNRSDYEVFADGEPVCLTPVEIGVRATACA